MYRNGITLTYKAKRLILTCAILLLLGVVAALGIYLWYLIKLHRIESFRDLISLIEFNIIISGPTGPTYKIYRFLKSMHWSGWHWAVVIIGLLVRVFFKIADAEQNIVDHIAMVVYELVLLLAISKYLVYSNYWLWGIILVVNAARFLYYKLDRDNDGVERVITTVALAFTFWCIFGGLQAFNRHLLGGFLDVDFFHIYNWGLVIVIYLAKIYERFLD